MNTVDRDVSLARRMERLRRDHERLRERRLKLVDEARAEGWSYGRIAKALGVTPQAIHQALQRRDTGAN